MVFVAYPDCLDSRRGKPFNKSPEAPRYGEPFSSRVHYRTTQIQPLVTERSVNTMLHCKVLPPWRVVGSYLFYAFIVLNRVSDQFDQLLLPSIHGKLLKRKTFSPLLIIDTALENLGRLKYEPRWDNPLRHNHVINGMSDYQYNVRFSECWYFN